MPGSRAETLIRQWHEQFSKDPLASRVVAGLRERSREIWGHTFQLLTQESPEYRNAVDDEFTEESKAHCGELLRTIVSIPTGRVAKGNADPFDFVRIHAKWRAQRKVPLIASLHAYRLAHRTYSEVSQKELARHDQPKDVVRSLTLLSAFWIELFDHIGAVLAEAHAAEEGLIVAQNTRSYGTLIDGLLRGAIPGDSESKKLCTHCGIQPGATMAIAVAKPFPADNGKVVDIEVTIRSLVRLMEQALSPTTFGNLIDVRNGEVVLIVCRDGDAARMLMKALQQSGLSKRASKEHSTRIGVSLDSNDVAHLPRALEEARTALDFASPARPLMHFAAIDLSDFLVRRADGAAMRLLPSWVTRFQLQNDAQATDFSRTVHAFADCSFNVKRTAQRLGVHTNTVYFRLNRIKKITGVDPRTYSGITSVLTTLRLLEVQGRHERLANQRA